MKHKHFCSFSCWLEDKTTGSWTKHLQDLAWTHKRKVIFYQKPKKDNTTILLPCCRMPGLLFKSKSTHINHDRNCGWVILQQAMIQTFSSRLSSYKKVLYRNKWMSPLTFFKPTHRFIFLFLCLFFNEGVKLQPFDCFFFFFLYVVVV